MVRIAALLFILLILGITFPVWFFALAAFSRTFASIIVAGLFMLVWALFIGPVIETKVKPVLDEFWESWWHRGVKSKR